MTSAASAPSGEIGVRLRAHLLDGGTRRAIASRIAGGQS
jgi:hypothetical protein